PTRLRSARARVRESRLPPHPPQGGRSPGRQPRLRVDDLGPVVPPRGVPDRGYDPRRHGAPRPSARRRAGTGGTAPVGVRGAAGGAVPPDARGQPPTADPVPCGRRGGATVTATIPATTTARPTGLRAVVAAIVSTRTSATVAD